MQLGESCAWGPRELEEAGGVLFWSFQRAHGSADTWIWDFWLQNCERIDF